MLPIISTSWLFITMVCTQVSDDDEGKALMNELGVSMLPTIQYYRGGKLLWEQRGSVGMEQGLGESEWC